VTLSIVILSTVILSTIILSVERVFTEAAFPRSGISPNALRMAFHRIPLRGGLSPNIFN